MVLFPITNFSLNKQFTNKLSKELNLGIVENYLPTLCQYFLFIIMFFFKILDGFAFANNVVYTVFLYGFYF